MVFHGSFTDTIERIRDRVPRIATWLWVDDGDGLCPEWATPTSRRPTATTTSGSWPLGPQRRPAPHDLHRGTTGMPKGVMWRQDDLFRNLVAQLNPLYRDAEADPEMVRDQVKSPAWWAWPRAR